MNLLPLRDLIISKPRPETTLSLVPAFREQPKGTVETYLFTDTIRHHFTEILETVATGRGQGFWIQAEYGAGKTHFLAALAALLANQQGDLWPAVQDEEVRLYQRRLQESRLFPVVVSLRGMGQADTLTGRSLVDVLLENGFQEAVTAAGLSGQVQVTAAEDLVAWLENQASPALRQDVEAFVRHKTGRPPQEYRAYEGTGALARLIAEYCQEHAITPTIAASVKDRLAYLYRQITSLPSHRYNGLLVVIDEYEGWEKTHASPAARAHDEDVLETLAYLLPRDLGYSVYTIVASQSAAPAKLQGGQAGDRFIPIPLLASQNERDYDIIVSRRVRGLNEDRLPEIRDHYDYCRQQFDFAQNLTEQEFRDIFPFQPRCFEVARHITARDLPTARSGIIVFHEAISHAELLRREMLIRVADLLKSPHLVDDCLSTPVYREAYNAYKVAKEALPTLELDDADSPLAQAILDTLFLWYLAYMERPRPMSLKDLAQATLTTSDFLQAEDNVALVLAQMQSLPQVCFENQQASFTPAGGEGPSVVALFNEYRRRAQADSYAVSSTWTNSFFLRPQETQGLPGLFSDFAPDEPVQRQFEHRNLVYSGQVIVASRWQLDWGLPLPKEDLHFRVVILTSEAAQAVSPQDLQDRRIAVVVPSPLDEEATRAAADYLAWQRMNEDYAVDKRNGKDADPARAWLAGQRGTVLARLIDTHLRQYQNGRVVTKDNLGISARTAFGLTSNDRRIGAILEQLLMAAYPQLPVDWERLRGPLRPAEASRVFDGYFAPSPRTADTAAARNFGVALGFSHAEKPSHFAPQQSKALDLIAHHLEERKGELPVWRLYETLANPPYGLPYVVIQLYLLAFLRRGDPKVELTLKRDHKLRMRSGQPVARDRLTATSLVDLDFRSGLERGFDALVAAAGPSWNDTLAYGREIAEGLRATTDPADAEQQAQHLATALSRLKEEVADTRPNLASLQKALDGRLPENDTAALHRLDDLYLTAGADYATFYERATVTYKTPDDLRDDRRAFERLKQLSNLAAEIISAKRYLEDVQPRQSDQELAADRFTLLGQLSLDSLAAQPNLWAGLKTNFETFQGRYRNAYQKHHRDTQAELKCLQDSLAEAPRRLQALALLNSISELGTPRGEDLAGRFQALQQRLQPCPAPFNTLTLEISPVCPQCGLTLTAEAPRTEVEGFLRDLERALTEQQRCLASEAIRRVLARSRETKVTTFVQVVQTANLAALVDVMDEELVTFIRVLLAEEEVGTGETDVLHRFAQDYPTLEEADLPKAVAHFEKLLQEAFAEARQANPEKKAVRLTLR
ncbi:MAG: DUF6079 family protein [Anaerolineae bacterium]